MHWAASRRNTPAGSSHLSCTRWLSWQEKQPFPQVTVEAVGPSLAWTSAPLPPGGPRGDEEALCRGNYSLKEFDVKS